MLRVDAVRPASAKAAAAVATQHVADEGKTSVTGRGSGGVGLAGGAKAGMVACLLPPVQVLLPAAFTDEAF